MAVTKIWKVEKRLDHVIDYTSNEEKIKNGDYGNNYNDLHNMSNFVDEDFIDEKQYYVSGINCLPDTAYQEMMITKKQYNKKDGILAFHSIQSFVEGEVTPELAHKIGLKLAEEIWGDRFEVLVSTHLNTNHMHNHFVINSVSFKDGKRYYDNRSSYAELRNISDRICEEYGLSVIKEKKCKKSKIDYSNYQKYNYYSSNYYTTTKDDIDRAIAQSYSFKDFEQLMKSMNYELYYRYNKISVVRAPYKKRIRIERCYGVDYSIDRIKERIQTEKAIRIPFIEEFSNKKYYHKMNYKKEKPKGIYALYLHYCYLLNVIPQNKGFKKIPLSIREDSKKVDLIVEETKLLVSNNIKTDEQFFSFKEQLENNLNNLQTSRARLYYHKSVASTDEEKSTIYQRIDELSRKINEVKKKLVLCDDIAERSNVIEKNINELIEIEGKESEKNEHVK